MHTKQLLPLCGLLLASSVALASKLDHDDVPNSCWDVCSSVVRTANSCDDRHERDSAEIQCICDWDQAKTQIPICSACITQHQADRRNGTHTDQDREWDHDHDHDDDDDDDTDDDDDDNEALDLVRSCGFTTTTYVSGTVTTLVGSVGTSTATAASTEATTTDAFGAATSNTASATDSSSPNGQDSSSVTPASSDPASTSPGSASSPSPTPDAAAGTPLPGAASMAGIMGLMALAWL
ncbi:hypothetical protein N7535_002452 [Penicillium sp. DV-2018c]|nr:hypothetical protein N7461_001864 [Penicillium sp. DV-2018c]KAJ5575526.1 hypothetical protein N7535_002452 [Penicillium sp. DV-2018c]